MLGAVCVFCGSSTGTDDRYAEAAVELGLLLAGRGIEMVYGGGHVGLMGVVADACMAAGGRVVGVIPKGLFTREVAHRDVTVLHEVASMHERKQMMYDLADAFVALPGGLGTLEELAEVATWTQLGLHGKPVALVDVAGFWEPLARQLDHMVAEGFMKESSRALVRLCRSPADALDHLATAEPVHVEKWITPEER